MMREVGEDQSRHLATVSWCSQGRIRGMEHIAHVLTGQNVGVANPWKEKMRSPAQPTKYSRDRLQRKGSCISCRACLQYPGITQGWGFRYTAGALESNARAAVRFYSLPAVNVVLSNIAGGSEVQSSIAHTISSCSALHALTPT